MATLVIAYQPADRSLFDPNRPDIWGAALSALLPLALLAIVDGLLAGGPGVGGNGIAALGWVGMLALWGAARWAAWQAGAAGRRASWWVVGLIGWGIAVSVVAPRLDLFGTGLANVATLLLIVAVAGRLYAASRLAFLLVLPSLLWVGTMAAFGFAAIASGWSPGFPSSQQGAQGSGPVVLQ